MSLISESRGEEFLYIQSDLIRGTYLADHSSDVQNIALVVSDCQVECQFSDRIEQKLE